METRVILQIDAPRISIEKIMHHPTKKVRDGSKIEDYFWWRCDLIYFWFQRLFFYIYGLVGYFLVFLHLGYFQFAVFLSFLSCKAFFFKPSLNNNREASPILAFLIHYRYKMDLTFYVLLPNLGTLKAKFEGHVF